jgi:hypothetical protein
MEFDNDGEDGDGGGDDDGPCRRNSVDEEDFVEVVHIIMYPELLV